MVNKSTTHGYRNFIPKFLSLPKGLNLRQYTCDVWILHMINICCCLGLKSKQISELFQKRGFHGSTGVIGYADSEFDNVNDM